MTFCSDQADLSVWKRMQTAGNARLHPMSAGAANRHSAARLSHPVDPASGKTQPRQGEWKRLLANRERADLAREVTGAFFKHAGRDWAVALVEDRQAVLATSALTRTVARPADLPPGKRCARPVLGDLKPVLAHTGDGAAAPARPQIPVLPPRLAKAA